MPMTTVAKMLADMVGPMVGTGDLGTPEAPDNWGQEAGGYINDQTLNGQPVGGFTHNQGVARIYPWHVAIAEKTFDPTQSGAVGNCRVHMRYMKAYVRNRSNGSWSMTSQKADAAYDQSGSLNTKDYQFPGGNENVTIPNSRLQAAPGAGTMIRMINDWCLHGWPLNMINHSVSTQDCYGVHVQMRLVPIDPSQPFDWANHRVSGNVGGDNYSSGPFIAEHCHSAFKRLTNVWQCFAAASVVRANGTKPGGVGISEASYTANPMPLPTEEIIWLERGVFTASTNKQTLVLRRSATVGSNKVYNISKQRGTFTTGLTTVTITAGNDNVQFDVDTPQGPVAGQNTLFITDSTLIEDTYGTFDIGSGTATGTPGGGDPGTGTPTQPVDLPITGVRVQGIDVAAMITAASQAAQGSQRQAYANDLLAKLGAMYVEIRSNSIAKYRTVLTSTPTVSSDGIITLPAQFMEPGLIMQADPLTANTTLLALRNAASPQVEVQIALRAGGGAGMLSASGALTTNGVVRTNQVRLLPPVTLDINVSGGAQDPGSTTGIYSKATLISDMTTVNQNSWGLEVVPSTQRGGNLYAEILTAINRTDGDSGTPNSYLSDATISIPTGTLTLTDATSVNYLGWAMIGRASGATTARSSNTRVQLRGFKLFAYLRNGTWTTLTSDDTVIIGQNWQADLAFAGNETIVPIETGAAVYHARAEPVGNGGGESLGSIGYGGWGTVTNKFGNPIKLYEAFILRVYPLNYSNVRKWWVDNVRAVVQVCEGRMIVHDATKVDDRSTANLMVASGGTWRAEGSHIGGGAGVGRVKLLTNNWQIFSWSSVPSATLTSTPPTGYA